MDNTYTDVNMGRRDKENFGRFYHQVNARIGYVLTWGLSGFLEGRILMQNPTQTHLAAHRTPSLENFFLLNGKVSYQIHRGIRPFLAIENLTNSHYARKLGFSKLGRRLLIGI